MTEVIMNESEVYNIILFLFLFLLIFGIIWSTNSIFSQEKNAKRFTKGTKRFNNIV